MDRLQRSRETLAPGYSLPRGHPALTKCTAFLLHQPPQYDLSGDQDGCESNPTGREIIV